MNSHSAHSRFLVFTLLLISACSAQKAPPGSSSLDLNQNSTPSTTHSENVQSLPLKSILWETSGGGDLLYRIDASTNADKEYPVQVLRKDFKEVNIALKINDPVMITRLDSLFAGETAILGNPPSELLTGTWSKVTLTRTDETSTTLKSPRIEAEQSKTLLDDLYKWVSESCDQNKGEKSAPAETHESAITAGSEEDEEKRKEIEIPIVNLSETDSPSAPLTPEKGARCKDLEGIAGSWKVRSGDQIIKSSQFFLIQEEAGIKTYSSHSITQLSLENDQSSSGSSVSEMKTGTVQFHAGSCTVSMKTDLEESTSLFQIEEVKENGAQFALTRCLDQACKQTKEKLVYQK